MYCGPCLKNIFFWTVFFGLLLNQAYCLKCYSCLSLLGQDCELKPKQNKFIRNCSDDGLGFNPFMKSPEFSLQSSGNFSNPHNTSMLSSNLLLSLTDCAVFVFTDRFGNRAINRFCAFKHITCNLYRLMMQNYTLDKCQRCESDLCNSSMNLSLSYWYFFILAIITTNILQ